MPVILGTFEHELAKITEEYSAKQTKDSLTEKLSEPEAELVIFGAGAVGLEFAKTLGGLKSKLKAFCDNFKTGIIERFSVPIISPEQLLRYHNNAIIVVAASDYYDYSKEIYNQLIRLGVAEERIFRRYCGYDLLTLEELTKYMDGYKWAYTFFEDETSKRIILDRIKAYLFYYELACSPVKDQYFDQSVIRLTDHEVFVDGGCYIGDTSLEFIKKIAGKYSFIYGFEPDIANYNQACKNLAGYENIKIINKGLYNQETVLSFHADGASSTIGDEKGVAEIQIHSISLDKFFSEADTRLPTFIKFDIEGAEKNALIGAKNIIKEAHPKLAICVYHKPEDIYEIPQVINEFGDYSFTLRHYTKGIWETVLYAIPK